MSHFYRNHKRASAPGSCLSLFCPLSALMRSVERAKRFVRSTKNDLRCFRSSAQQQLFPARGRAFVNRSAARRQLPGSASTDPPHRPPSPLAARPSPLMAARTSSPRHPSLPRTAHVCRGTRSSAAPSWSKPPLVTAAAIVALTSWPATVHDKACVACVPPAPSHFVESPPSKWRVVFPALATSVPNRAQKRRPVDCVASRRGCCRIQRAARQQRDDAPAPHEHRELAERGRRLRRVRDAWLRPVEQAVAPSNPA